MASTFKELTASLKKETENKYGRLSVVKIPYSADIQNITNWCLENIGDEYTLWAITPNAHNYVLFIPDEFQLLFKLRWGHYE